MVVGIGIDVVEIDRIRGLAKRQGRRFLERVFTPGERRYCGAIRDPYKHYAARFAAKEAAMKALGTGLADGIHWQDVEVVRARSGAVTLKLARMALTIARRLGARTWHVSLSHTRDHAVAIALLEN